MDQCDLLLDEHEGAECADPDHRAALIRLASRASESATLWSSIVRGADAGGRRDFLDGEPIHCGSTLELQAFENREDFVGDYSVVLPTGALVRYELGAWNDDGTRSIELHAAIAGYKVVMPLKAGMRFRWPKRE